MDHTPNKIEQSEDVGFMKTVLWAGGALAVVAGIAVYAGMQG